MLTDAIQILSLLIPKVEFTERVGIGVLLQNVLWLCIQYLFYLLGPGDDSAFKNLALLLIGDVAGLDHLLHRKREESLSLDLTDG